MASDQPPSRYGDLTIREPGTIKPAQTWIAKDKVGERLEILADEICSSTETLSFALKGQVVACINGWLWYRLHVSDLPKT